MAENVNITITGSLIKPRKDLALSPLGLKKVTGAVFSNANRFSCAAGVSRVWLTG